ncbi:hypothetical protein ACHQM5_006284 [Ranunculus cassubicifolius]
MVSKLVCLFLFLSYNGFKNVSLGLDGTAEITKNGLVMLTNLTEERKGHAFYPKPLSFKNKSTGEAFSFSTTFVFAIVPQYRPRSGGHGMVFVIAPSTRLTGATGQFLGLFNRSSNGKSSNHVLAIEFDTVVSSTFSDPNQNHVGIDINSLNSTISAPLNGTRPGDRNLLLMSGKTMQAWIDYNGSQTHLTVTLALLNAPKPKIPLLSLRYNLSFVLLDSMFVGFSAATGSATLSFHYVQGWSFQMNGQAQELDLKKLPKLPRIRANEQSKTLTIALPVGAEFPDSL